MACHLGQDEWCGLLRQADYDLAHSTVKPWNTKAPNLDANAIAGSIDHTLLKLDATREQIDDLCAEAKKYVFKVQLLLPGLI